MKEFKAQIPWPLVWLASYPKSGNTWFRIFLNNYLQNSEQASKINELQNTTIASSRYSFDILYGIDSVDLSFEEIDLRRPAMYAYWTHDEDEFLFHKVHDAYTYLPNGQALLGNPERQAALYFIRNPFDVAVSFAHHNGIDDLNKQITLMGTNYNLCDKEAIFFNQLRQHLLSWSEHVISWQKAPMPHLFIRYEDMVEKPFETFSKAIRFLQLPDDAERIQRAINLSSMEQLQKQEQESGFQEKPSKSKSFFRKGKVGDYREKLSSEQIKRIMEDHREVIRQFGYDQLHLSLEVNAMGQHERAHPEEYEGLYQQDAWK